MASPTKEIADWIIGRRSQEVYFRRYPDGDVIAILPKTQVGHVRYGAVWDAVLSYMGAGEVDAANESIVVQQTVPAKPSEYAKLLRELRRMGYSLTVTNGPA